MIRDRAEREPRRTGGVLRLLDLDLEYVDALSLMPQFYDIFVRRSLAFEASTETPTILDCGANVGLASIWLKRAYPNAQITAVEADPAIHAVLERNLRRNGIAGVTTVHAAVWREETTIQFRCEGTDSGAIDTIAAGTAGVPQAVPAIRLRDLLRTAASVDLLKMDIEGAELAVLEDAAAELHRVRALQVEVHDFDAAARSLPRCLSILEQAGFEYALDDFSSATWRTEATRRGPFEHAVPAWIVLVRAWPAGRA